MEITVCIGSSCHLKGSYEVIGLMKDALSRHGLTAQVNLCAAFCLGRCSTTGCLDGERFKVTPLETEAFFNREVMKRLEK